VRQWRGFGFSGKAQRHGDCQKRSRILSFEKSLIMPLKLTGKYYAYQAPADEKYVSWFQNYVAMSDDFFNEVYISVDGGLTFTTYSCELYDGVLRTIQRNGTTCVYYSNANKVCCVTLNSDDGSLVDRRQLAYGGTYFDGGVEFYDFYGFYDPLYDINTVIAHSHFNNAYYVFRIPDGYSTVTAASMPIPGDKLPLPFIMYSGTQVRFFATSDGHVSFFYSNDHLAYPQSAAGDIPLHVYRAFSIEAGSILVPSEGLDALVTVDGTSFSSIACPAEPFDYQRTFVVDNKLFLIDDYLNAYYTGDLSNWAQTQIEYAGDLTEEIMQTMTLPRSWSVRDGSKLFWFSETYGQYIIDVEFTPDVPTNIKKGAYERTVVNIMNHARFIALK
jgi:hypothetical protein